MTFSFRSFAVRTIGLSAVLASLPLNNALADEILRDVPADSADELPGSFDHGAVEPAEPEIPFEEFFESSRLNLNLRNYWLNRDKPEGATDPMAWTQGNSIEYRVGRVGGIFDFRAEYFGSFPLVAPGDRDGTLLLMAEQDEIDVLGVLNPGLNYAGNRLSLFRQKYDLPFVNQQDNRMIPNTFEGYTVAMTKADNPEFQYVAGYIDSIKSRNNDSFVSMSTAAGGEDVGDKERGMILGGARYYLCPEWSLGAIDEYVDDIFNNFYTETIYSKKYDEDWANSISAQYASQTSAGDDLYRGESYSTGLWGVLNALSYKNAIVKLAYNQTDSGALVASPYGSYPGYTSSIVEDFNRAGEKSWMVGLSYKFTRIGLKELSLSTAYIHGFGAIDESTKELIAQKEEVDVTVDYLVGDGVLKGLSLRARSATIEDDDAGNTQDFRFIVNYQLRLLEPESKA